jgi:hypothetical protein
VRRHLILLTVLGTVLVVAAVIAVVVGTRGPAPAAAPAPGASTALSTAPSSTPSAASSSPSPAGSPSPSASRSTSVAPASGVPRLLFGMGTEADSARRTALVRQAPVKMLTSWYNSPKDLSWMAGWRTGTVPSAYAAGYAMHLIVWTGDPEGALSTPQGPACGRGYPLSDRFPGDMQQLAGIFAGQAKGPPLYVTMFTEFQTYPCVDNSWSPNPQTTNYYRALQERYRTAYAIFHRYAPNARVSLGWGGWQTGFDNPSVGGGRSLFSHFADVMRMSDFQSFQAMSSDGNVESIRSMVATLGGYGPVMLAHYKPDNGAQSVFDADVRAVLTDRFLAEQARAGLFAVSFMDNVNLAASPATYAFVKGAVTRYGRGW